MYVCRYVLKQLKTDIRLAVFLPRDAMHKRGLLVSVTFVYCVKTAKDTAIVTMECERETVPKLSSGTIFNDLE